MSNKPNRKPTPPRPGSSRRPTPRPASRAARSTTPIIIGAIVAVIVVIAVVVALVVSNGGDDDPDSSPVATNPTSEDGVAICPAPEASASAPAVTPSEPAAFPADDIYKPVAVTGDPLPAFTEQIQEGSEPDIGLCEAAPVVSGYDYAGDPITVDAATDGPTLVVVLAHWCPHCNREVPVLNAWRDAGDVPDGLDVVGVSTAVTDSRDNYPPDQWLDDVDWQWPVLADDAEGTALSAYGGTSFPTLLFIGSDGLLKWRLSGEYPIEEIQTLVDGGMAAEA